MISSTTIALIAATVSLASAQSDPSTGSSPACLNLETASEASAFARGVQLMSLQKGTVNAICFAGGSVKLDAVPDIVQVFASDPASISGKFTDAAGAVTPLRCEFPKDSITELLKSVRSHF
jgi:expansin (peptidoglycan-binding protein)